MNGGGLDASESFNTSRTITLGSNNGMLRVADPGTVLTVSGSVTGPGSLSKFDAGTLVLANPNNNYQGGTLLSDGTLSISSSGNLGNGPVTFTGSNDSTLQFTSSLTLSNDIYFPLSTAGYCYLDTQGNTVTLTGQLWPPSAIGTAGSFNKTGSGTLILAAGDTTGEAKGTTYVEQGTVKITAVSRPATVRLSSGGINVSPAPRCSSPMWHWATSPTPLARAYWEMSISTTPNLEGQRHLQLHQRVYRARIEL